MAELTLEARIAEVLSEHATVATGLGKWACGCSPMVWRPTEHRAAHVAAVLAPLVAAETARAVEEAAVRVDGLRLDLSHNPEQWRAFQLTRDAAARVVRGGQ